MTIRGGAVGASLKARRCEGEKSLLLGHRDSLVYPSRTRNAEGVAVLEDRSPHLQDFSRSPLTDPKRRSLLTMEGPLRTELAGEPAILRGGQRGRCLGRGLGAHSAAHVPRIRNETEGSFRVTEVVPNLGLHPCSRITIEGLNEASYSADACSEREPEIV